MMKSKSMVWRLLAILFFTILFWGGGVGAYAEKKAWVKFGNGTLTFMYGEKTSLFPGYEFWLNEGTGDPGWSSKRYNVVVVEFDSSFASARPNSCYKWFQNFNNLQTIKGIEYLNTSNVTNMAYMFYGCQNLTSLDVSNFDTSNVTNMGAMFTGCSGLTVLDVSSFNTSKVMIMYGMFMGCSKIETIFASDKFDVSNVTNSNLMFTNCTSLKGYDENKTDKTYATVNGGYFTNVIRPWVKYADGTLTFQYGYKKTLGTDEYLLNEGSSDPEWINERSHIQKVVFDKSFAQAQPTSCYNWFYGCSVLSAIEGIENLNTSNVTDMSCMFEDCPSLTSLDLLSFDTQNVTNMSKMFFGCSSLSTIYTSDKFVLKDGLDGNDMFKGCTNLVGAIAYDANKVDKTYAKLDGGYFTDKAYTRPWVKFADGTLTFYYGYKKTTNDNEFGMNADCARVWFNVRKDITKVVFDKSFAVARPVNCVCWFEDCSKLTTIEGFENLNTSNVTNMASMFYNCSQLTLLDLSTFDTQNVGNMFGMFDGCSNLATIYVSDKFVLTKSWGTNVFSGCRNLVGDITYDTYRTDLTYAKIEGGYFSDKVYTRPWVKYSNGTLSFKYGYKKSIDENEYLLNGGSNAPQWYTDHTAATETNSEITKVTFDKTFSAARPTSCYKWFYGLNRLDNIVGLELLNTSEVTNMSGMFGLCESLTSLELSHFDTQKVADMSYMFSGAEKLQTIYVSDQFVLKNAINSQQMFNGCTSLKGDIAYDANYIDKTYAKSIGGYFIDILNLPRPWVKYADGTLTFRYGVHKVLGEEEYLLNEGLNDPEWYNKHANSSEKVTDITKVVFDKSFGGARPKTCYAWFGDLVNLKTIEGIENLNTSEVTNMLSMFWNCSSLASLDLSHFDTRKVERMNQLFFGCSSLMDLDLSSFNTSKVTKMYAMFYGCSSLESLDLSNFDMSNVTDMSHMFYNCSSLKSLNLSNVNTSNVTDIGQMFNSCSSLESLDLSYFDTSNVTDMNAMFWECSNLKAIYLGEKFSTAKATSYNQVFIYAPNVIIYSLPNQYESAKADKVLRERAVRPYVRINKNSEYGTLCVPVGSSLAEGSFTGFDKLYQVQNADKDKGTITMEEAKNIEPGVPYVYHRYLEGVDFEGENDMSVITFDVDENASSTVTAPKNENSLLKGTFESIVALGGSYILQTDGNFHPVAADNTTLRVGAYRAYLDLNSVGEGGAEIAAKAYQMVFEDSEATGIDRINGEGSDKGVYDQADSQPKVYFDLMGRKVVAPQKGEIYIVNGKKVIYNK